MTEKKNSTPKLIFIAEDNTIYAKTLQAFLKTKFKDAEVDIFPVGELIIDNMDRHPDVIIMDYVLNSRYTDAADGLTIIKDILAKKPGVKIIALSAQQQIEVALAIKDLGCGYFVKNNEAFDKIYDYILI